MTTEYSFKKFAYGTFIKIGHMLVHKISLNNLKEMKSYRMCSQMLRELNQKSMRKITHGEHAKRGNMIQG